MQTSKKIILASYIMGILLTAVTAVGAFFGKDVATLGIITGAAYAEIAASNAFYFNKAKKENALKNAFGCSGLSPERAEKLTRLIEAIGGL